MYMPGMPPNRPITAQLVDSLREIADFRRGVVPKELRDRVHRSGQNDEESVNARTVETSQDCGPDNPVAHCDVPGNKATQP